MLCKVLKSCSFEGLLNLLPGRMHSIWSLYHLHVRLKRGKHPWVWNLFHLCDVCLFAYREAACFPFTMTGKWRANRAEQMVRSPQRDEKETPSQPSKQRGHFRHLSLSSLLSGWLPKPTITLMSYVTNGQIVIIFLLITYSQKEIRLWSMWYPK